MITVLVNAIEAKWTAPSISLVQITRNLIDAIRPAVARSLSPVFLHPLKFTGCPTPEKLSLIRSKLFNNDPSHGLYVLPVLPSIAWLLNIRCRDDVPNTPIFRSYVTLTRTECTLYADKRKIPSEVEESLARDGVKLAPYGVEHVKDYIVAWKKTEGGRELKVLAPPSVSWGMVHQIKMAISVRRLLWAHSSS
jgi:Xaa-Pro aminopeptidase